MHFHIAGLLLAALTARRTLAVRLRSRAPQTNQASSNASAVPSSAKLLMKLRAGSVFFDFDSAYWINGMTYDHGTHGIQENIASENDDADTKLAPFMTWPLDRFYLCWGTLTNCYTYRLGKTFRNARSVFEGDYMASPTMGGSAAATAEEAKKAWTDLFLPPGDARYDTFWDGGSGRSCSMHSPGINTKCDGWNWARIGYCVNAPAQHCQDVDADTPIGIGLRYQEGNTGNGWSNGPFGSYLLSYGDVDVSPFHRQAWLFGGSWEEESESPTESPTAAPTAASAPAGQPSQGAEVTGTYELVMKLKAGSDVFDYDSLYWTNGKTYSSGANAVSASVAAPGDDADVKLGAFNTAALDRFYLCWGTLTNCYTYRLGTVYSSARAVFQGGYLASDSLGSGSATTAAAAKKAFTDLFLPSGDKIYSTFWDGGSGTGCPMQSPGINTKCDGWNWARIGYCVNVPTQGCLDTDADAAVGIGLRNQDAVDSGEGWTNGPFGEYFLSAGEAEAARLRRQAWLFVSNGPATLAPVAPTSSPTEAPTSAPSSAPTAAPTASPTDSPTLPPPTNSPTNTPTGAPTELPTTAPTDKPTKQPTKAPTAAPATGAPTEAPTEIPTGQPTVAPTLAPTDAPTSAPSAPPTGTPTLRPTGSPSQAPTATPSLAPTTAPTVAPTDVPTESPTESPTKAPKPKSASNTQQTPTISTSPTSTPTTAPTPTMFPTSAPTAVPTVSPTKAPTELPTESPTTLPTESPTTLPTESPTDAPTQSPTELPTGSPTKFPTLSPSNSPTASPSNSPTSSPTASPTKLPTEAPTNTPTGVPTNSPTFPPTKLNQPPTEAPTKNPTETPTVAPTQTPTEFPTQPPTTSPTSSPTTAPTTSPTATPTLSPTDAPTAFPTNAPTMLPTTSPTEGPTKAPTTAPTEAPTESPTALPTVAPTATPTDSPSQSPTLAPTSQPTLYPTAPPTSFPTVVAPQSAVPEIANDDPNAASSVPASAAPVAPQSAPQEPSGPKSPQSATLSPPLYGTSTTPPPSPAPTTPPPVPDHGTTLPPFPSSNAVETATNGTPAALLAIAAALLQAARLH